MPSFGSFLGLDYIRRSKIVVAVGALAGVGYTIYSIIRRSRRTAAIESPSRCSNADDDNVSSKKLSSRKESVEELSSSDSGKYDYALKEEYELSEKELLRSAQTEMTGVSSLISDPSLTLDDINSSILDSTSLSSRRTEITYLPPVEEKQAEEKNNMQPSTSKLQTVEEEVSVSKKPEESEKVSSVATSEIDSKTPEEEIEVIVEPEETSVSEELTGSDILTAPSESEWISLSPTPMGPSVVSSTRSERRRTLEDVHSSVFDTDSVNEHRSRYSKILKEATADVEVEKHVTVDMNVEVPADLKLEVPSDSKVEVSADSADEKSESTTGSLLPSASSEMTTVLLHSSSSESNVGSVEVSEHNLSSDEVSSKILSETTDRQSVEGGEAGPISPDDVLSGRDDSESHSGEFEHVVFYERLSESQEFSERDDS